MEPVEPVEPSVGAAIDRMGTTIDHVGAAISCVGAVMVECVYRDGASVYRLLITI